jgi:hypothetical protein
MNRVRRYSILTPKRRLGDALCQLFADLYNVRFRQLAATILLAVCHRWNMSALIVSIMHIFGIRTKPKMVRVNAWRVVARVADAQFIKDRTKVDFPRDAMRKDMMSIQSKLAITMGTNTALPHPAFVFRTWSDMLPEAICHFSWGAMVPDKARRLPVRIAVWLICLLGNGRVFSASTLAFAVRLKQAMLGNPRGIISCVVGEIWGTIGAHKKSPFLCLIRQRSRGVGRCFCMSYSCNYNIGRAV